MNELLDKINIIGFVLAFLSFMTSIYLNMWIYYSADKSKFPLFPFLNPISFSSFALMFNSMFKMHWEIEGESKKLKRYSNNFRDFSLIMLLLAMVGGMFSVIIN